MCKFGQFGNFPTKKKLNLAKKLITRIDTLLLQLCPEASLHLNQIHESCKKTFTMLNEQKTKYMSQQQQNINHALCV